MRKVTIKELEEMIENGEDYSKVDVSGIKDFSNLFKEKKVLFDITKWNVSSAVDMSGMFFGAKAFNQDISNWDVSNVENMESMFAAAEAFNQPLNGWDVSTVRYMAFMFEEAKAFNQPLNDWDVSKVKDMEGMFSNASSFNQSLRTWNVSRVIDFKSIFSGIIIIEPMKGLPFKELLNAKAFKLPEEYQGQVDVNLETELDLVMFALNFEDRPDIVGMKIDFEQDNQLVEIEYNVYIKNSEGLFIKIDYELAKEIKSICDKKLYERPKPTRKPQI